MAMARSLAKFYPRAPRYVLRSNDQKIIRYASDREGSRVFSTRLLNLSETGMAFLVRASWVPTIGSRLKVEFPVPGGDQVAWWATVVRLEEYEGSPGWKSEWQHETVYLVGVRFHELPDAHLNSVRSGLQKMWTELYREQRWEKLVLWMEFLKSHGLKLSLAVLGVFLTFMILYALSRPSENYDAKRGAPWGQRFK